MVIPALLVLNRVTGEAVRLNELKLMAVDGENAKCFVQSVKGNLCP